MGVRPFCELHTLLWIAGGRWFGIDILNARKRVILFSSRSFHSDKDDANTCFYGYQWLFRTVYNKSPQSYKNCCKSLAPITLRKCGSKLQSSVTYVHCPSWRGPRCHNHLGSISRGARRRRFNDEIKERTSWLEMRQQGVSSRLALLGLTVRFSTCSYLHRDQIRKD